MVILEWLYEYWLPIRGYEGLYEVSNFGRIKGYSYKTPNGKILKSSNNTKGYLGITLCKNRNKKHYNIHRLVAEAFIPNPKSLPCVNHKSEVKTENMVWNLEWCDYSYNNNYGSRNQIVGSKNSKPVLQFTKDGQFVNRYDSMIIAEGETKISFSSISQNIRGRSHSAGGFIWRYA